MQSKRLTIIGAGIMGSGVAQLFAQYGFNVTLIDTLQSQLDKAKDSITHNLHYLAITKKLPLQQTTKSILELIVFTTQTEVLQHSDCVIENITENWELKKNVYRLLNEQCNSSCIFGVNTSSISITKIASLVKHPQRVIGLHFMNPAPMMPMVEVIKGYHTNKATIEYTRSLLE